MGSNIHSTGSQIPSQSESSNQLGCSYQLADGHSVGNLIEQLGLKHESISHPLPATAYNPLLSLQREANVTELVKRGYFDEITVRGARVICLDEHFEIMGVGWPTETSDANRAFSHVVSPNVDRMISLHPDALISSTDIIALSEKGISGASVKDGKLVFEASGVPLVCIDVRFLQLPNVTVPCSYPFKAPNGTPLVPLVGDIMLAGQEISHTQAPSIPKFALSGTEFVTAPAFTHQLRGLVAFGLWDLPVVRTNQGGFKFALQTVEPITSEFETVSVAAWQFVGVGTRRYVVNTVLVDTNAKELYLPEYEVLLIQKGRFDIGRSSFVQDQRYAGKRGILLDRKHQNVSASPTGGDAIGNLDVERDMLLWERGAQMARVMCVCFEIVNREKLIAELGDSARQMVCESTYITAGPVFDDTHRLDMFFVERGDMTFTADVYDAFLLQEYGASDEQARLAHLSDLSFNMGTNLRICLDLNFVSDPNQIVEVNVNRKGKLLDSGNFRMMENRFEALDIIYPVLRAIAFMRTIDGTCGKMYFSSEAFTIFVNALYGQQLDSEVIEAIARRSSSGSRNESLLASQGPLQVSAYAAYNVALELTLRMIQGKLIAEGKGYRAKDLLALFLDESQGLLLPTFLWKDKQQVREWLKQGLPDTFRPSQHRPGSRPVTYRRQELYDALESRYISKVLSTRNFHDSLFNNEGSPVQLGEVDRATIFEKSTGVNKALSNITTRNIIDRKKQLRQIQQRKNR